MGLAELINIERKYKCVDYEIKGRICYRVPYGHFIDVDKDNKIHLSDTLLKLYKECPLNYMRVNHILGYRKRPCTTNVIVDIYETDMASKEYKYTTIRYSVEVDEENKCLKIEIDDSKYQSDVYIVEKVILEVIDYLTKLKNKKGKH